MSKTLVEDDVIVHKIGDRGQSTEPPQETGQSSGSTVTGTGQSSGESTALILKELQIMRSNIESVSSRVDKLSETVYGPLSAKKSKTAEAVNWADRSDSGRDRPFPRFRADSEDEAGTGEEESCRDETLQLSENNLSLVESAFSTSLSNTERRRIRRSYPISGSSSTRCPKLDPVFKSQTVKADYKPHDGELTRLQAIILDPATPYYTSSTT